MAWSILSDYGPTVADANIENLMSTVDGQRRGYDFVTLTNWDATTSAPAVSVGSIIEINGAVFEVSSSNVTIGSVPGGATSDLYIKLTVSGGSTVTADWTTTAPSWDAEKGGWFNGTTKYLAFICDYDGGGSWSNKREILSRFDEWEYQYASGNKTITGGIDIGNDGTFLKRKVLEIGDWNMDSTTQALVAHGLSDQMAIRAMSVIIRNDLNNQVYTGGSGYDVSNGETQIWIQLANATNISILRLTGGIFDSTSFDSTSYNRGWVTIWYEV